MTIYKSLSKLPFFDKIQTDNFKIIYLFVNDNDFLEPEEVALLYKSDSEDYNDSEDDDETNNSAAEETKFESEIAAISKKRKLLLEAEIKSYTKSQKLSSKLSHYEEYKQQIKSIIPDAEVIIEFDSNHRRQDDYERHYFHFALFEYCENHSDYLVSVSDYDLAGYFRKHPIRVGIVKKSDCKLDQKECTWGDTIESENSHPLVFGVLKAMQQEYPEFKYFINEILKFKVVSSTMFEAYRYYMLRYDLRNCREMCKYYVESLNIKTTDCILAPKLGQILFHGSPNYHQFEIPRDGTFFADHPDKALEYVGSEQILKLYSFQSANSQPIWLKIINSEHNCMFNVLPEFPRHGTDNTNLAECLALIYEKQTDIVGFIYNPRGIRDKTFEYIIFKPKLHLKFESNTHINDLTKDASSFQIESISIVADNWSVLYNHSKTNWSSETYARIVPKDFQYLDFLKTQNYTITNCENLYKKRQEYQNIYIENDEFDRDDIKTVKVDLPDHKELTLWKIPLPKYLKNRNLLTAPFYNDDLKTYCDWYIMHIRHQCNFQDISGLNHFVFEDNYIPNCFHLCDQNCKPHRQEIKG